MDRVTLKDIADATGVSTATVSKVVNSRGDVKPETRQAVLKVASDLGYRKLAQGARPGMSILFVVSSLTPYSTKILSGAIAAAAGFGLNLIVNEVGDDSDREWFYAAAEIGYAGVIGITMKADSEMIERASQMSLPLILIDPEDAVAPGAITISSTNWVSGRRAAEHLLDLGHERIGVLGGSALSGANLERIEGCRSAMEDRGFALPESHVVSGEFDYEHGLNGAKDLLGMSPRPTAVIALADILAAGAIRAFYEAELTVPNDVSLVSFDDTDLARQLSPALTTISQPLRQMGQVAVERISMLSSMPGAFASSFQIDTGFVDRSSTAGLE